MQGIRVGTGLGRSEQACLYTEGTSWLIFGMGWGGLVLGWDICFPSLCHPRVLAHPPNHPPRTMSSWSCGGRGGGLLNRTETSQAVLPFDAPLTFHGFVDTFTARTVSGR